MNFKIGDIVEFKSCVTRRTCGECMQCSHARILTPPYRGTIHIVDRGMYCHHIRLGKAILSIEHKCLSLVDDNDRVRRMCGT